MRSALCIANAILSINDGQCSAPVSATVIQGIVDPTFSFQQVLSISLVFGQLIRLVAMKVGLNKED
jgi:hypothetical protein